MIANYSEVEENSQLNHELDPLGNHGNEKILRISRENCFGTLELNSLLLGDEMISSQISSNIEFTSLISGLSYGTICTQLQSERTGDNDSPAKSIPYSNADEQVISPLLARVLEENTSNTSIRVIVTLKAQPQIEESFHIKEVTGQRIESLTQSFSSNSLQFLESVDHETMLMRKELKNHALDLIAQSQDHLVNEILKLNGTLLHRFAFLNSIAVILSNDAIKILQHNPNIQSIVLDELQPIQLNHSVPSIYADDWHSYGFDGAPWDVAVLDTGVDATHPALSTRVIDAQCFVSGVTDPDDTNGHGTHVAGIIASTHTSYLGVAPGASIINAKIGNPGAYDSDVIAGAEWAAAGASDDAEIINHSYGVGQSKGRFIDAFVDYYDIIWVGAAGNDGPDGGTVENVGYNMITVGSMDDQNTDSRSDDTISSFSSRGPTWDNRIKPDLVAPGDSIYAPCYDWEGLGGLMPDYIPLSGTSMASPHVAGTVALLYDYMTTDDTKYYKSLLMHTADDWGTVGPDNTYGWGYVNMASAYSQRDNVLSGTVQQNEKAYYRVYLTAGSSYQATIAFERHGVYYPSTNSYSLSVLSDLDLSIYSPDGSLLDFSASGLNNVEQVNVVSAPLTGYYQIQVYGSYVDSGVTTESFSLAHDGGLVRIYQPDVTGVVINGISVPDGGTDGSYNRTDSFNIEISVTDLDTIPASLSVQMEVYDPTGTYRETHTMPYNSTANIWENSWIFGQDGMAGTWYMIVKTDDNTGLSAQDYSFYFLCDNELPEIHMISLSSNSVRRLNETLDIGVNTTDYHDGTNLISYFTFWMPNGTFGSHLMQQNPANNLFYLNLTFSESVPLGIWSYCIYVEDSDLGFLSTEIESFEVLSHQYILTILSPWGTPTGGGLYDAGAITCVGLDVDIVTGIAGERFVFQSWTDDASGTDYSQSDPIIMDGSKTVTALWDTEYYLSVISSYGTPSGEGWYVDETIAYAELDTDIVAGVTGERFVFQSWTDDASGTDYSQSDPIIMDCPKTATAVWNSEYYLMIASSKGTPIGNGWYVSGNIAYAGLDAGIVAGVAGERFIFQSWSGDASGADYSQSDSIIMNCPKTATAIWNTEYYLTVISSHGTPSGDGWYVTGSIAYSELDSNIIPVITGEQLSFQNWIGDATGIDYSQSNPIIMNASKTAIAYWDTEYYLTVVSSYDSPTGEDWYTTGAIAYAGLDAGIIAGVAGERFIFQSWSGDASGADYSQSEPIIMDGSKTVTALWDIEYYLTVTSAHGIPSGEGWYSSSSTVFVGLDADIVAGITGERFVFQSWTDDASGTDYTQSDPITLDGPKSVTVTWQTQYQLTCITNPSGLSPLPTIDPAGDWFNDDTIVILNALEVVGYTFQHWLVDDVESEGGIASITLVMDETHFAIACYQIVEPTTSVTTTDTEITTTGTMVPSDDTLILVIVGVGAMGLVLVTLLIAMKKRTS